MAINRRAINGAPMVVAVSFTPSIIFDDRGKLYLLVSPTFAIRL